MVLAIFRRGHKIAESDCQLRHVCLFAFPMDGFFMKFYISVFFEHLSKEKLSFIKYLTRITGTLHEDLRTFTICRWIPLIVRKVSGKSCTEKHNVLYAIFFFENHTVYEKMWKSTAEPDRPQMKIWRMHFACWIAKAIDTASEYVILLLHCSNNHMNVHSLPCWHILSDYIPEIAWKRLQC